MTNLKLVLRTYSALRQMSPDDIALLEMLRALNDGDRELMVETLQGKATTRKVGKKSTSKSSQSSTKSPRASGMATQLSSRRQRQQKINEGACTFILEDGAICNTGDNNPIHDETFGYAAYHPFVSTAPPAPVSSSANGELSVPESSTRNTAPLSRLENSDKRDQNASLSPANSETPLDDAGTVAHGASGGRVQG